LVYLKHKIVLNFEFETGLTIIDDDYDDNDDNNDDDDNDDDNDDDDNDDDNVYFEKLLQGVSQKSNLYTLTYKTTIIMHAETNYKRKANFNIDTRFISYMESLKYEKE
jgi:hypothetical protein